MHSNAQPSFISVAPTLRHQRRLLRALALLSAGSLAVALAADPVWAQNSTGTAAGSAAAGGTAGNGATGTTAGSSLSREDRDMIEDLAEANIAEMETGRLALNKSQTPRVREFAQKMIDDHGAAQQELQQMAQAKGMTLPQETDLAHRTVAGALRLLSGNTFDSQYLNRVGMDDHKRTVELLQKAQSQARDTEFKALAARLLPVVQGHLDMARQMSEQGEKEQQPRQQQGSAGTTGSGTGGYGSTSGSR